MGTVSVWAKGRNSSVPTSWGGFKGEMNNPKVKAFAEVGFIAWAVLLLLFVGSDQLIFFVDVKNALTGHSSAWHNDFCLCISQEGGMTRC